MTANTAYTPDSKPSFTYSMNQDHAGDEQILIFGTGVGAQTLQVRTDHPRYAEIREAVLAGERDFTEIRSMVDLAEAVSQSFRPLSDRVKVSAGRVFFDGDEIHNAVSDHIIRCLEAGLEDYKPLVRFMENLAANPTEHSRDQLYEWLTRHDFTLTQDGCFIAYKGVMVDEAGEYVSVRTGPAIVNGKPVDGHVPNPLGAVVEIARSKVQHDPSVGCASGLHAGTHSYAKGWAQGALLKVKINPRDVVSVPTDCEWQKIRTSRYEVLEQIDAPETKPVEGDSYGRGFYGCGSDCGEDFCEFGCEGPEDCDGACVRATADDCGCDTDRCPDCGTRPEDADLNYCSDCGEPLQGARYCGDCGTAATTDLGNYCRDCGEPTD